MLIMEELVILSPNYILNFFLIEEENTIKMESFWVTMKEEFGRKS